MSKSITQKALSDLKIRVNNVYQNIDLVKKFETKETSDAVLRITNEIKILIDSYEKQIELNKKQNIKIKNQKAILRVLQQKAGVKNGKANI